jgi:hypothetical protein
MTPRRRAIAALLAVSFLTFTPALAEDGPTTSQQTVSIDRAWTFLRDQGFSGSFRFDYFRSSKLLDDDVDFFGGTAQFKVLPRFTDLFDGKAEVRITNPAIGTDEGTDARVLEGYVTARMKRARLRLGKQIIAWGRADGINPTDNVTPHDYTVLLPFEEDQRFGTIALRADAYLTDEHTLTLITTPFFEPSEIPLIEGSGIVLREKRPAWTPPNSEVGVRLDKTGGSLDWSMSYFYGFDLLPDVRILGPTPAVELQYNRMHVFGGDAARNFGRYGFRGEAAYVLTRDKDGTNPGVKNPFLFFVLGVDRTFFENLNINLQFLGRRIWNYSDPEKIAIPLVRAVAIEHAIFSNQQDRFSSGFSSRIGDKWLHETLEAEILLFVYLNRPSAYIRPLITYAFTDHIKGTVGGEIYQGGEQSFFGRVRKNRGVFAEVRYSF